MEGRGEALGARAGGSWGPLGGVGTCVWSHGRVLCRGGHRLCENFRRTLGCMWMEDFWGQEWWPGQGLVCRDLGGLQWTTLEN